MEEANILFVLWDNDIDTWCWYLPLQFIQEQSPKHPVEVCIHPDNKQRNRYANIQCCKLETIICSSEVVVIVLVEFPTNGISQIRTLWSEDTPDKQDSICCPIYPFSTPSLIRHYICPIGVWIRKFPLHFHVYFSLSCQLIRPGVTCSLLRLTAMTTTTSMLTSLMWVNDRLRYQTQQMLDLVVVKVWWW